MNDMKSIRFSPSVADDMVRAILEDRKTVTRRVVKGYALDHLELDTDGSIVGVYNQDEGCVFPMMDYAPYQPGDILYVRETFQIDYLSNIPGSGRIHYKSDDTYSDFTFAPARYEMMRRAQLKPGWRPNENMPREAARIFLRVTDVRAERLQDITEEQARKEGAVDNRSFIHSPDNEYETLHSAREHFAAIWDNTIKKADRALYGWEANSYVWVIEFERCEKPEGD